MTSCQHYQRYCNLVAPCCGDIFPCRLCHDEIKNIEEKVIKKKHTLDRFKVIEIVCNVCKTQQEVSEKCINCSQKFGKYTCIICRMFDDIDKGQFHCKKCGICRVGGKDNFYHCDTCGACYPKAGKESHICFEENSKNNCPICLEALFDSTIPYTSLRCGHVIHSECLEEYGKTNYKCPSCQKSMVSPVAMASYYQRMKEAISLQPLPEEYQKKVIITCRECDKKNETDFHYLGQECPECGSFNTCIVNG